MFLDYFHLFHAQQQLQRCCGASPMTCCKMLQVFVLDDFFRCLNSFLYGFLLFSAHTLFWPTTYAVKHLLVCHPNSSQNEFMWMAAATWFNTVCSKPFQTGFQIWNNWFCKYPKTFFPCNSLISLNYEKFHRTHYIHIYIYIYIFIFKYTYLHLDQSLFQQPSP